MNGFGFPSGHFHSPIPDPAQIAAHRDRLFPATPPTSLPGIDLRLDEQKALLRSWKDMDLASVVAEIQAGSWRYTLEGQNSFNLCDAMLLHCMLRHLRPRRYVEIGCGLSSCMALDTNERFLHGTMTCTFIDISMSMLRPRLRAGDTQAHCLIEEPLQDQTTEIASMLEPGDVLFIDSSHVLKADSDVGHILFRLLPALRPGVHVHMHDVFYPFEYPEEWITKGWYWNEAYALRALLQHNDRYAITLFVSYIARMAPEALAEAFAAVPQRSGGSFWMRVTR